PQIQMRNRTKVMWMRTAVPAILPRLIDHNMSGLMPLRCTKNMNLVAIAPLGERACEVRPAEPDGRSSVVGRRRSLHFAAVSPLKRPDFAASAGEVTGCHPYFPARRFVQA